MDLPRGACEIRAMVGGEGIGEVVTGALLARALEPAAGEATDVPPAGAKCLNCGTPLVGPYCHECGQTAHVRRSLFEFWHDIVHGLFQFEGKIWRTLPLLAWRPGELTRRYIEGERARFVSPMALFLFSVFLMFAAISAVGGPFEFEPKVDSHARTELSAERDKALAKLGRLNQEKAALAKRGGDTATIEGRITDAQAEERALSALSGVASGNGISGIEIDGVAPDNPVGRALTKVKENPSLIVDRLQTNAYKYSWALIPISVPFVWLLFAFQRRYRLYDHTVFVTYSIAFMTLLVVALSVARVVGVSEGLILVGLLGVPPIHMYRQLKGAYQLSHFGALWRTIMLVAFAFFAGLLFFLLLMAIGLFG